MIRVLGGRKQLCDGLTRRDLLHAGGLSLFGMGLTDANISALQAASAAAAPGETLPGFGKAKACILLFLYGSPSQLETFDPKPAAPSGIRGEWGSIPSNVPGMDVCEMLPKMSRVMDRATVIRSMTHPHPLHGVAFATSGIPRILGPEELNPRDTSHWPFMGSVVEYADRMKAAHGAADVPGNLVLPFAFSSQRIGEVARAGPYAGFLGGAYDPISVDFDGKATKNAKKTLRDMTWDQPEPYRGITPESRFRVGPPMGSNPGVDLTFDRLDRRRSLLDQFERARANAPDDDSGIERHRSMAYSMLGSPRLRQAFDLDRESADTREMYGMTLFGQATLTARRLVEAGGRFITVFWDEYGLAGTGWDTHWDHYNRMRDELLPGLDQTLSALLLDLDRRGMLDETLVLCLSEHGRTPQITTGQGGGRDHWSRCYSTLLAGGGIARGRVVGRSDKVAGDPVDHPVSPKDILATTYHLLGVAPDTMLADRQGRPMPLTQDAKVIAEALA
ncbi:DUF1501 domain-containing protein [Isosphaeraceae bacterium EP7]